MYSSCRIYLFQCYFTWPGQATAYKVGQLKIIELRELTETSLAENFDIKEFHDIVLNSVGLLAV